jgi:hypothetical protein
MGAGERTVQNIEAPADAPRCEAAADRPLMEAYLRAVYRLRLPAGAVDVAFTRFATPVQAGAAPPAPLPARWAFVTAYNPMSCPKDDAENRARDAALGEAIRAAGLAAARAEGRAPEGDWREPGWALLDAARDAALDLGRRFGQRAILWGLAGRAGVLDCRTEAWVVRPIRAVLVD